MTIISSSREWENTVSVLPGKPSHLSEAAATRQRGQVCCSAQCRRLSRLPWNRYIFTRPGKDVGDVDGINTPLKSSWHVEQNCPFKVEKWLGSSII
jgi:hypothetical protein